MRPLWSCFLAAALLSASAFSQAAEQKPVLTVYTYDSFAGEWGPGAKIKLAFVDGLVIMTAQVKKADLGVVVAAQDIIDQPLQMEPHRPVARAFQFQEVEIPEPGHDAFFGDHGIWPVKITLDFFKKK